MARIPKPTRIAVDLKGDPGRHRTNTTEPQAPSGAPLCPKHLTGIARDEWQIICNDLEVMGLLTKVDTKAIETCCQTYKRMRQAEDTLERDGYTFTTATGIIRNHPAYERLCKERGAYTKLLIQFGLTPAARASMRVNINNKPKGKINKIIGESPS